MQRNWRIVFRQGLAPQLDVAQLTALADALRRDDEALFQGGTTVPPPAMGVESWPVEAACAIGYCGWRGSGLVTVGEINEFFARTCYEIDKRMDEPAACRWFLNWFDEMPRPRMVAELLDEVEAELLKREGVGA